MGKKILILSIIKNLRKRLKLILFTAVLSMAAIWIIISFVLPPNYQAVSQILVEDAEAAMPTIDGQPTLAGPSINEASSVIIRSPDVLKRVILDLKLEDKKIPVLHDQITVSKAVDSKVLNITVMRTNRKEAAAIADAVASIFIEEAPKLMIASEMTLISSAADLASDSPTEQNMVFALGVAGAFGLIVGTLLAFILELLNAVFKTGSRKEKGGKEKLQTVFK